MKNDEIKQRLDAAKAFEPWAVERVGKLQSLNDTARAAGLLLLGCDADGKPQAGDRVWSRRAAAAKRLKALNEADVLALGTALFPQCPDVFRAAWTATTTT